MLATEITSSPTILVTTLHFCNWCRQHTRHEFRGSGMVCLECADKALFRELDRE